jgi:hypothetical protein
MIKGAPIESRWVRSEPRRSLRCMSCKRSLTAFFRGSA